MWCVVYHLYVCDAVYRVCVHMCVCGVYHVCVRARARHPCVCGVVCRVRVCVCRTHPLNFFPLVFVLVVFASFSFFMIFLSLLSCGFCCSLFVLEMRAILLLFVFLECICIFVLFIVVSNH